MNTLKSYSLKSHHRPKTLLINYLKMILKKEFLFRMLSSILGLELPDKVNILKLERKKLTLSQFFDALSIVFTFSFNHFFFEEAILHIDLKISFFYKRLKKNQKIILSISETLDPLPKY